MTDAPARDASPVPQLFDQLFAASRVAHAGAQHEVAYHTLAAAMHAAQDAYDVTGVRSVEREAQAQIAWIDTNVPQHRLSTASAGRHNHPGVYSLLARQARTIAGMLSLRK